MQQEVSNYFSNLKAQIKGKSLDTNATLLLNVWQGKDDQIGRVTGIQLKASQGVVVAGIQIAQNDCQEDYFAVTKEVANHFEAFLQELGFRVSVQINF